MAIWLQVVLKNKNVFKQPHISNQVTLHTYLPTKMEQTECSEMLAYKIQMPGNYPEESIQPHFIKKWDNIWV